MSTFNLSYIKEAIASGHNRVDVLCRQDNAKTGESIYVKKSVSARVALAQMSRAYSDRSSGWKMIYPLDYNKVLAPVEVDVKIDQNSLSDPKLLQFLADNPDALKALQKGVKEAKKVEEPTEIKELPPPSIENTDVENN